MRTQIRSLCKEVLAPATPNTPNNSNLESALDLARKGFNVLPLHEYNLNFPNVPKGTPIPPGSKYSREQWGKMPNVGKGGVELLRDSPLNESQISEQWGEYPNDNVAIITHHDLVVIDADNIEADEWCKINANTPIQVKTFKGTHYYFRKNPDIDINVSIDGDVGLDIRAIGGYIVAPPSKHGRTGQIYRWQIDEGYPFNHITDIPIISKELWAMVQEFSPKAHEKGRKVKSKNSEKVTRKKDDSIVAVGQRNSTLFSAALNRARRGDDFEKLKVWASTFCNNFEEPLGQAEIETTLKSALSIPKQSLEEEGIEIARIIEEFNQRFSIVSVGSKVPVMEENVQDPTTKLYGIKLRSLADFRTLFLNKKLWVTDKSVKGGGRKQVSQAKIWLESPNRREYKGLYFDPSGKSVQDYFNLWQGFAVKAEEGSCLLYQKHILDNICQGDVVLYFYVMNWMADVVQNPTKKPGIALGFRGGQGTGKGIAVEYFGLLFGNHYCEIADPGLLTGNFNAHLKDNVVLFADEAVWGGNKKDESKLKNMITSNRRNVEMKGVDIIQLANHTHLLLASNEDWIAPIAKDDRRFCILDVGDKQANNREYFGKIINQMKNEGGTSALLHHLLNRDLTGVDLSKIPETQAQLENKLLSLDSVESWLFNFLKNNEQFTGLKKGSEIMLLIALLFRDYQNFCGENRQRAEKLVSFTKKVKKALPSLPTRQGQGGKRHWAFFDRDKLREDFSEYLKSQDIKWDE
jgi:hypothetical protein